MKLFATIACLLAASVMSAEDIFVSKVEPLLKQRCFECHSHEGKIKGGLALDSKSGWERGGESGPALVPGKPEASLLMQALSHAEKDVKMPPKKMLPAAEIAVFAEWIRLGAPDPRVSVTKSSQDLAAGDTWDAEFHKRLDWWSLRPMRKIEAPKVDDGAWSKEPVDRFVRAALFSAKLQPAPPAEPSVLRRRLSFVLTGLPPSAASASLSDEAYVDMLLQSPRFGEHFARHWMDVVRYTDTYGYEWDNPAKGAYEYRDYLIRAFNDDISFAQFLREQIAGDLLPRPRINTASQTNESLIGPMFYHLGEHRHGSSLMFNGIHQEMVNNKIDAFSKAFLATTVACARCHDHKLEAVSQHDYYALAAIFTTPRWTSRVIDAPNKNDAVIAKLKELRAAIRAEVTVAWKKPLEAVFLKQWAETHGAALKGIGAPLAAPDQLTQKAAEWRKARMAAQNANAIFKLLADPARAQLPRGWVMEGDGTKHGFVEEGTPLIALEGDAVIAHLLPRGWHTHALSSKLPGALRMPPEHLIPGRFVSLDLAGGEFGGQLVIDDHAFQNESIAFYTNTLAEWKTFADAELKNGVQQVTVEFATSSLNPNFPPRTGLAKGLKNDDFGYDKRSWLSVCGIVSHDKAGTPQDEQNAFAGLYDAADSPDSWQRIAAWFNSAVTRWREGKTQPGDQPVLDWLLSSGLLPNKAEPGSRLATLVAGYRSADAGIDFPRTVNSMDQRETAPASYPLNVRGNVDVPGTLVQPGFLKMLDPSARVSDRLTLADSLLAPEHPLTARVYVNRVWQWLFGTGLVATPDDFGRLGVMPSHPELLDWLAREFIREGWSTKKLVRRLVLSQTFRQSGLVADAARERDPENRLLHHYPTRRLEAEAIRDSLLAISGRLDMQLYGRPVLPFRSAEDAAKRLFSGPLDGHGRRSIYLQMSIMDPPKFLVGFNLPDLKLPAGRRDVTNVPSQALIMLNDPFVNEMAKYWTAGLLKNKDVNREDRVRQMFEQALARSPDATELRRWTAALQDFGGDTPNAWERLAHALFNTKEFLYYR